MIAMSSSALIGANCMVFSLHFTGPSGVPLIPCSAREVRDDLEFHDLAVVPRR
jgi:hypothetical protein